MEACAHQELPGNDRECLAIAQHYGLATRLLDWRTNPLVATFFAASELPGAAGALFCYSADLFVEHEIASLDAIGRVVGYRPRAIDERINRQQGVFTFHPEPNLELGAGQREEPLGGPNLVKIQIPAEAKESILTVLSDDGLDAHTLFPGLDGLSRKINHETAQSLRRKAAGRLRSRAGGEDSASEGAG
ncbi:MAG: FRG domain-containing protein [Candidatus Eisenbacteria bacterium]